MKYKAFLQIFGGLTIVLTLLRFIAVDYWWVRVFDFPHVQLTILSVLAFAAYFIKFDFKWRNDYIFATLLMFCMLYQFYKIYTYTPLASFEIMDATLSQENKRISFYTANVFQDNKEPGHLQKIIDTIDVDILLFTETNKKWQKDILEKLPKKYGYKVEKPLPNTYGMLLYSKLELIEPEILFQVDDSIPSIHTKVRLPSGDVIQICAIHPTPPMPQHNPMSTKRDKEMMLTAKRTRESKLPVVVIGDFNDVAWSQTTILFQRTSGLLDPRKGRGLFNTFNAKNFLMRWPLDHVFIGPEFRVVSMHRGEKINSDHFPMYIELSLEPDGAAVQKLKPPTEGELKRAEEQMKGSNMSIK